MFSLIRTAAHACLTLSFEDSGFSLLITVQLRGFVNGLHHQGQLSHRIGLQSVITRGSLERVVLLKVGMLLQMYGGQG